MVNDLLLSHVFFVITWNIRSLDAHDLCTTKKRLQFILTELFYLVPSLVAEYHTSCSIQRSTETTPQEAIVGIQKIC